MQNIILLVLAALFVYLLFSRKGGMGCCGGHGAHNGESDNDNQGGGLSQHNSHGHHGDKANIQKHSGGMGCCGGQDDGGARSDQERQAKELSPNRDEHIIDLTKDQYTVLPRKEHMQSKVANRVVSEKVN